MNIEKLTQIEFDKLYVNLFEKIKEDPIKNFIEASGFIGIKPTPGQLVLFKLVMNIKLDAVTKHLTYVEKEISDESFELEVVYWTEIELYEYFTSKSYDSTTVNIIRDITLIIGRRGSKTMCAAILAIYCAIKMNWKPLLGRKRIATTLVMSHTKELSDEIIDEVKAMLEESPILQRLINKKRKNTQSTINLKIPFLENGNISYSYVNIRSNAASSKSTRGFACPTIIGDEIAFWGSDPQSKESDKEIVRASKPSTLQFKDHAMWITLSSPNIKQGVLYEMYEKRKTLTANQVVLKSPSWVFNSRYRTIDFWNFWNDDPENFDREFRANFLDSTSSLISNEFIDLAVMNNVEFQPPEDKKTNVTYTAGIDAAFKKDKFTFSVTGVLDNRVKQYVSKGWEGTKKNPVKAVEVAQFISKVQKEYGFDKVIADQYAFQPLKELFELHNIVLEEATFTQPYKKKIYYNLKRLIHSQQIDLLDKKEQTAELKALVAEQNSYGNIKIGHPPRGSDDYADSLAAAAMQSIERTSTGNFSFEASLSSNPYGIKVDQNGTAFDAPSPEMLGAHIDTLIHDNSSSYEVDPVTKKLKPIDDDDDDGVNFSI